jgi:type III pantothenate kinase
MLLAMDIGNSNIVIGCIDMERTYWIRRVTTDRSKTDMEYAILLKNILDLNRIPGKQIDGAILCSVVPQVTGYLKQAVEELLHVPVMVAGISLKTGIRVKMDRPETVGADLIVGAVGALTEAEPPVIIVDLGTATTVTCVDRDRNYIGGMIIPGMRTSLDALSARAAQLPALDITEPEHLIGKNTVECMHAGIIYSNAAMIDGCADRIEEELGQKASVIVTGGLAKFVTPYCRRKVIYDDDLMLKGLLKLYEMNR